MRASHLVLAVVATFWLILGEVHAAGRFSPSSFRFVTTRPDDGKDVAGGWQEASAQLEFVDGRRLLPRTWSCQFIVGVPLRTATDGKVSPDRAAAISADVATVASSIVMHRRPEWIPAAYCLAFCEQMRLTFKDEHASLGARVRACR